MTHRNDRYLVQMNGFIEDNRANMAALLESIATPSDGISTDASTSLNLGVVDNDRAWAALHNAGSRHFEKLVEHGAENPAASRLAAVVKAMDLEAAEITIKMTNTDQQSDSRSTIGGGGGGGSSGPTSPDGGNAGSKGADISAGAHAYSKPLGKRSRSIGVCDQKGGGSSAGLAALDAPRIRSTSSGPGISVRPPRPKLPPGLHAGLHPVSPVAVRKAASAPPLPLVDLGEALTTTAHKLSVHFPASPRASPSIGRRTFSFTGEQSASANESISCGVSVSGASVSGGGKEAADDADDTDTDDVGGLVFAVDADSGDIFEHEGAIDDDSGDVLEKDTSGNLLSAIGGVTEC